MNACLKLARLCLYKALKEGPKASDPYSVAFSIRLLSAWLKLKIVEKLYD